MIRVSLALACAMFLAGWLAGSLHPAPRLITDLLRNDGKAFADSLQVCPKMQVSNRPATDGAGRILSYRKFTQVRGVKLATNPAPGACLSSGFGERKGRKHQGVDFSARGGPILAAGEGAVIERTYLPDYGNTLLIDHGNGVYTRYAHLASFAPELKLCARVRTGQQIGRMGNTAGYRIPIHLHYEILIGDYANPKGSFGLEPRPVL